jgi:hypothetical protein
MDDKKGVQYIPAPVVVSAPSKPRHRVRRLPVVALLVLVPLLVGYHSSEWYHGYSANSGPHHKKRKFLTGKEAEKVFL